MDLLYKVVWAVVVTVNKFIVGKPESVLQWLPYASNICIINCIMNFCFPSAYNITTRTLQGMLVLILIACLNFGSETSILGIEPTTLFSLLNLIMQIVLRILWLIWSLQTKFRTKDLWQDTNCKMWRQVMSLLHNILYTSKTDHVITDHCLAFIAIHTIPSTHPHVQSYTRY